MLKKILITGCSGSGKTTLANTLHKMLSLPLIHLDHYYWQPNWQEPNLADWENKLHELCQSDEWIMDGNYTGSLSLRLLHADFVIFLDMPRWLCLLRVLKRSLLFWQNKNRQDLAPGCQERFNLNLLKWIWGFPKRSRQKMLSLLENIEPNKKAIVRSRKDMAEIIRLVLQSA